MGKSTRPPAVDGILTAGVADAARLMWWSQKGYQHGIFHGSAGGRAVNAICAVMWWPMWPLLWIANAGLIARKSTRYYMSPNKDATLAIAAKQGRWVIGEHLSARPGTGQGRALRAVLLPVLGEVADREGVAVEATAASGRLAEVYRADVPELEKVGRGFPRGVKLRRAPR